MENRSEPNIILVDITKIHTEIEKERVILALQSKIIYGDVTVKKKHGQIYHVDIHYSLQWKVEHKES